MSKTENQFWQQTNPNNSLPPLQFVHGNSYPTGTYRQFLGYLKNNYQIHALEMHGHNPAHPVTDNWPELSKELISCIEINSARPVILVGHSLGGLLSLMVAKMRPELVRCVVMLDSPIVAGWRANILHVFKKLRLQSHFSPAKLSKRRRVMWSDPETAFQHFSSKEIFNSWPEQVLRDYIYFGTEPCAEGITLRYKRDIETAIYNTLPHIMNQFCELPFPVPVGFIWGMSSKECRQAGLAHTKKLVGSNFAAIKGGHLFPLESPQQAAEQVHRMVQKLLETSR